MGKKVNLVVAVLIVAMVLSLVVVVFRRAEGGGAISVEMQRSRQQQRAHDRWKAGAGGRLGKSLPPKGADRGRPTSEARCATVNQFAS